MQTDGNKIQPLRTIHAEDFKLYGDTFKKTTLKLMETEQNRQSKEEINDLDCLNIDQKISGPSELIKNDKEYLCITQQATLNVK